MLEFYSKSLGSSMRAFVREEMVIPWKSFHCNWAKSGLALLQHDSQPKDYAALTLTKYMCELESSFKNKAKKVLKLNRYLTENKKLAIMETCRMLSLVRKGISKDELYLVLNEYVNLNEDMCQKQNISDDFVQLFIFHNNKVLQYISASSLDLKRAEKVTQKT